jgi:hypothetical protein
MRVAGAVVGRIWLIALQGRPGMRGLVACVA